MGGGATMVEIICKGLANAQIIKFKSHKGYDCYKLVILDSNNKKLIDKFINYTEVEHYDKRIK